MPGFRKLIWVCSSIPRSIRFDGSDYQNRGLSSLPDVRDCEETVYGVRELTAPPRERLYFPCHSASPSPLAIPQTERHKTFTPTKQSLRFRSPVKPTG